MTLPRGPRFQPYTPTAASVVLLALLTVFLSVVSASWSEQFSVTGFIRTGNWATPSATPDRTSTTLSMDQSALGFFENGKYGVSGTIQIQNTGLRATRDLRVVSTVKMKTGQGQYVDYVQSVVDVSAMPVLAAGQSYLYKYRITFDPVPGALYLHNAKVSITNYMNWLPGGPNCLGSALCPFGSEKNATFVLPAPPPPPATTGTATPTPTVNSVGPAPAGATSTAVLPSPPPILTVVTATSTATATATPTPQVTATPQATRTPLDTPTMTASPTVRPPTASPTATASPQLTRLPQVTNNQPTPGSPPTAIITPTVPTPTATAVPQTVTSTATPTATSTVVNTSKLPTQTPTSSTGSTTPTK